MSINTLHPEAFCFIPVISDELFGLITHLNHELKIHILLLTENKWMHFTSIYTTSLRVLVKRNITEVLYPNSKYRRAISITLWSPYPRELLTGAELISGLPKILH